MKIGKFWRVAFAALLAALTVFAVCSFTACGKEEQPPGRTPGLSDDDDFGDDDDPDGPLSLANGARYEAEYATSVTGTPADKKKGFVGSKSTMSNKYVLKRLSVPGNCVTFTVTSDKAEEDVTLIAAIAAMNSGDQMKDPHKEALFDSVYLLSVNGSDVRHEGLTYQFEGEQKDHWFDIVEVRLTIDIRQGENVIKFIVPEAPEGMKESLYIGPNFDYIAFETESAKLTYVPNYNNPLE